MSGQYEVLSPWADVDPVASRGIAPRLPELKDATIGLFVNMKRASSPIQDAVEARLRERFPTLRFKRFVFRGGNREVAGTDYEVPFKQWTKEVDAVVAAVGD